MQIKLRYILIFITLLLGFKNQVVSQNGLIPAVRMHYGFIIPHSQSIRDVSGSNPWGIEAEWNWQLMSQQAWNYCYCFPRTGVSFLFIDFDNPEILGHAYIPYTYIEPVLSTHKRIHSSLRFGFGPAFMDKVYDEQNNPQNLFYSSILSFVVLLDVAINFRLTQRMNLHLSANYNHISNGGIKNPNKGINFPTMSIGLDYNLRELSYETPVKIQDINKHRGKWRFDIIGFGTGKSDIKGEQRFAVFGLIANSSRIVGRLSALSLAIEGTLDNADKVEIERNDLQRDGKLIDHKYLAAMLGHELLIGRFIFSTQLGVYLYSPFKRLDPLYQRYGLTFNVTDWLYIGTNIKAHLQVADFLDFRMGVSF